MTGASCLYEGQVRHRRFRPVDNRFRYGLFLVYLDLDELPGLFDGHALWSTRGPNVAWFRRADHLGDPGTDLADAVRDLVNERLGFRPAGPIRLLTHLRYFGHCFNPVSFYYCYDRAGEDLAAIVAEVSNMPWHERHCYVLDAAAGQGRGPWLKFRFPKAFHVSPFMDMDQAYDWRFRPPGETIGVHMRNIEHGRLLFDATLSVRRRPITAGNLARVLLRYPAMTVRVVTAIHWQALRLWRKGATFYPHPARRLAREEQP